MNQDQEIQEEIEIVTKRKGRPIKPDCKDENGRYISKRQPLNDKECYKKYYHSHCKQDLKCELCGSITSCRSNLLRHQKTIKCKNIVLVSEG